MDDWKELFSSVVLMRGLNYYREGAVTDLKITKNGFQAVVEGSYDYDVEIEIRDGKVSEMWCTCPYADDGNCCKHMAAVLFAAEELYGNDKTESKGAAAAWETQKQQIEDQVKEAVSRMPKEDMRSILVDLAVSDEKLRNRLIIRYMDELDEGYIEELKQKIRDMAYRSSDSYGYMDWEDGREYIRELTSFLEENVRTLIERESLSQAFQLVAEALMEAGSQEREEEPEDDIDELESLCYGLWLGILEKYNEAEKKKMFRCLVQFRQDRKASGLLKDMAYNFLMNEFHEEKYLVKKMELIEQELKEDEESDEKYPGFDYGQEALVMKKLELMEELHYPEKDIEKFKKEQWKLPGIRMAEVEKCLKKGDKEKAVRILEESKKIDEANKGRVSEYSRRLISLYDNMGRKEEYKKELVFYLFHFHRENLEFVIKLKEACEPEEWSGHREQLLDKNAGSAFYYQLLKLDGLYQRMMKKIKEQNDIWTMNDYEALLKEKFPEQVRDMYIKYVKSSIDKASNRGRYSELARYLKKIRQYPQGKEAAEQIAAEWKRTYSRRRALIDELRRAGFF